MEGWPTQNGMALKIERADEHKCNLVSANRFDQSFS